MPKCSKRNVKIKPVNKKCPEGYGFVPEHCRSILTRKQKQGDNINLSKYELLTKQLTETIIDMPRYVAFLCAAFTSAAIVRQIPNREARFTYVSKMWKGPKMPMINDIKRSVLAMADGTIANK